MSKQSAKLMYDYGLTVDSVLPWKQVQASHRGQYMSELLKVVEHTARTGFLTVPNVGKFVGELYPSPNEEVEQFSQEYNLFDRVRDILIQVAQDRILPGVNEEMDWGEVLIKADEHRAYDYRVRGSNEEIPGFQTVSELSKDPDWAAIENQITVDRNTEEVGEALSFFLSTADKLCIVDPYLLVSICQNNTRSRFLDSLREIDKRIYEDRAVPLHSLEIHSYLKTECDHHRYERDPEFCVEEVDEEGQEKNCVELIREYMPNCVGKLVANKMTLHLWRCNPAAKGACKHMHDRHILSGHKGVDLNHGINFAATEEESRREANLTLKQPKWVADQRAALNPNMNYRTHLKKWNLNYGVEKLSSMTTRPLRRS